MQGVSAPASLSLVHRAYRRLLAAYQASPSEEAGWKGAFTRAVTLAGARLQRSRRMRFPERRIAGWLWTSRWQFEILMRWNEWESVAWCRRLLRPGSTVVDVGAHIGYYTRLFSELAGPEGRVIAVEPCPENQDIVRYNLQGYTNVELLTFAAADRETAAELYVSAGSSNHSLVPGYTPAVAVVATPTRRIDAALAERGITEVDFIKIDVEGGEALVLRGLTETIAQSPRLRILLEYNPAALRCAGLETSGFLDKIRALGFRVYRIEADASLTQVDRDAGLETVNLLCCRTEDALL